MNRFEASRSVPGAQRRPSWTPALLLLAGPALWLAPHAGENRRLNGPLATPPVTGQVFAFELAPDGERLVYSSRGTPGTSLAELRSVPSDGSQASTLLSGSVEDVYPFKLA